MFFQDLRGAKMQTHTRRDLHALTRKRPAKKLLGMDKECPDPIRCLGLTPDRVTKTTELHFGGRRVQELHDNFSMFVNLEVLWLNNNCLTEVRGLLSTNEKTDRSVGQTGTRRLRKLMLSNNRISTVSGDIESLKYLEVLLLANNNLRNMEAVCQRLCQIKSLRQLDLLGNPLVEEVNYRLFVIHKLQSVEILDRHQVTQRERKQAAALFVQTSCSSTTAFGKCLPFGSYQATEIVFINKRWHRIFHLSSSGKGTFDLPQRHIIKIAQSGSQVHIRVKELPGKSVTSKPNSYPIQRLREGYCLSCLPNGNPATKKDVENAWEGCSYKNHLWSKAGPNDIVNRPITTCLYDTPGNPQGLQLICPDVGPGNKCGWTPASVDHIEVYVDVGIAGEEKPNPVSRSVIHLQSQVVQIRAAALKEAYTLKDKHNNALATQLATKSRFHETWSRRLGKSDFQISKSDTSSEVIQGKKDLLQALEILKKSTSEESIENAYREIHNGASVVGCLYKEVEGGHNFNAEEPFVPNRDDDCFSDEYQKYLSANEEVINKKEREQRLQTCFSPSQLSKLTNSLGNSDIENTSISSSSVHSLVKLLPLADSSTVTLSDSKLACLYDGRDSISLREFLFWLTYQTDFLTQLSETCRLQAAEHLSQGHPEKALQQQKNINTIAEYLKPCEGKRPVGWLFDNNIDTSQVKLSQKKKKEVRVGSPECATDSINLPPSGYNPRFGAVGADVDLLLCKYSSREISKMALTAVLVLIVRSAIPVAKINLVPRPPWG